MDKNLMDNPMNSRFLLGSRRFSGNIVIVMVNEFSLQGETALITGGGSGLGFGIAECFVASGATVVLVGRREEVLKTAANKLGKSASFEVHDITRVDEAQSLVEHVSQS